MPPAPAVVPGAATPTPAPSATTAASPSPAASASAAPSPSASPSTAPAPSGSPGPIAGGWTFVKQEKCPESRFECVTLRVPSDHTTEGSAPWDVTFAIQRATGKRLGTFVVIAGGPGGSGISVADSYTDADPASIAEHYDFVYPDQRGIGLSHPIGCPDATAAYYTSPYDPANPAEGEAAGDGRQDLRRRLHRGGEDPRVRAPAVRDDAGDRGPRGDPRLPGRRQARPLWRELRHPVRPDVRGDVSPAHPHAVSRRAGRPHARRADLPRGGRPRLRRRARRDPDRMRRPARVPGRLRGPVAARRLRRARREAAGGPDRVRLPDGRRDHPEAVVHAGRLRGRRDRLHVQRVRPERPDPGPRGVRGREPRAARPARRRLADHRPGHARADPGPHLVRRHVLRGRVPGLRLLGRRGDRRRPPRRRTSTPPGRWA